jgi:hypothetical protein
MMTMPQNFDEIVTGVVKMVDEHTSDLDTQVPTEADWCLIEEAAALPEAVLVED